VNDCSFFSLGFPPSLLPQQGKELFLIGLGFHGETSHFWIALSNAIVHRALRQRNVTGKLFSTIKTYETYFSAGTKGNKPKRGCGSRNRLLNQSLFFDLIKTETIRILMAKSYHLAYNKTPSHGITAYNTNYNNYIIYIIIYYY